MTGSLAAVAAFSMALGGILASDRLFLGLLKHLLNCPMQIFQEHSMGQFINRYSSDIAEIDFIVPFTIRSMVNILLQLASVLGLILYAVPAFGIIIPILVILYYVLQRFYVATSRQLKRLESTLRSPIFSHFGESISGVSTIRAYGQQSRFISDSERKVDVNNQCYFPSIVSNRYVFL
ncbi:multidrug resistance-associated protein 1-like [Saccostrea cucullata]|uniref:multidrug resistance-associated protein 1-like n=1 Tax=Saccostrea cuccullata TaxID=36930 RepID=UPI002ED6585F